MKCIKAELLSGATDKVVTLQLSALRSSFNVFHKSKTDLVLKIPRFQFVRVKIQEPM